MAVIVLILFCGCSPYESGTVLPYTAAYAVPASTPAEHGELEDILSRHSEPMGMHVDSNAGADDQFSLSVWGDRWDRWLEGAADFDEERGEMWITFHDGSSPERSRYFRRQAMDEIRRRWPETVSLPITDSGLLPFPDDVVRTTDGYQIAPQAKQKYQ